MTLQIPTLNGLKANLISETPEKYTIKFIAYFNSRTSPKTEAAFR